MRKEIVRFTNPEGLHGKRINLVIDCATMFNSKVWFEKEERRVNAESILGLLSLNILKDQEIKIIADGKDCNEAVEKMMELIRTEFNDEELIDEIKNAANKKRAAK